MKTLDLNNYGVQEMNAEEMRENNGGFIIELLFFIGACVIGLIMSEVAKDNE